MLSRSLGLSFLALVPSAAWGADLNVGSASEIISAFGTAEAGDRIIIAPGEYSFGGSIWTANDGPITVTTTVIGAAKLNFNSVEGLVFNNPDWTLEKIWVNGVCAGENCEAGVGVKQAAFRFKMENARVSNWTQHVKAARDSNSEVEDAQILGSEFWNDALRPNGSTPLDLVGGKRWRIAGNYVHDYGGDPNGDYGIFLKGGTSNGVIESNLVICARDNPAGGATVGISFGGGGTGYSFCPDQNCDCEDYDSIARNNIVLNCTDAGLHTKRACGSKFYNNTVYDTAAGVQIQINGAGAPVDIQNNVMSAGISGPGNLYTASNNLTNAAASVFRAAYADPDAADFQSGSDTSALEDQGANLAEVTADYCGSARSTHDLGAIEFPGRCETWPWAGAVSRPPPLPDAGVADAGRRDGGPGRDAGAAMDSSVSAADASPARDAEVGFDAGVATADGGDRRSPDAGADTEETSSGGCSASSARASGLEWLCALALLLFSSKRRRAQTASTRPIRARARDTVSPKCQADA